MTIKKFKLNLTLNTLFWIQLVATFYLAVDVVSNLDNKSESKEAQVQAEAKAVLKPMFNQLYEMQRGVSEMTNTFEQAALLQSPEQQQILFDTFVRELKGKLSNHGLFSGHVLMAKVNGQQVRRHWGDWGSYKQCKPAKTRSMWQSGISFDNAKIPRIEYQLNLDNITSVTSVTPITPELSANRQMIDCIGLSIRVADMVGFLYGNTLNSRYHIVFDHQNRIAHHPNPKYFNKKSHNLLILEPLMALVADNQQHFNSRDEVTGTNATNSARYITKEKTGQSLWLHNHVIDKGSWSIATVIEAGVDFDDIKDKNQTWLVFVMTTLGMLVVYAMLILRVRDGQTREYWQLVVISSVLSVAAIGIIWGVQLNTPKPHENNNAMIRDESALYHAVAQKEHHYNIGSARGSVTHIPILALGLRIDSIDVSDAGALSLIGLVWLKNTNCAEAQWLSNPANRCPSLDDIKLEFPEAEKIKLESHINNPSSVVKRFSMEINFPIRSSIYPFERGVVPIRVTTAGYNNPYRLVPDLSAYGMMNPLTKPGLSEELILKGWNIYQSYFSYQQWLNTAKYTKGDELYDAELTELYFNIEVGRKFLSPFIADMVPIMVITALLFLVLMTMTKNEEHMSELGFDASTMLGYCSGLFFVLTVAHVYLRESLNIDSIAYIEYFYFMMYFMILSISASAILFSSRFQQRFMTHEDGVVVKILFWPTIFVITLVFTFISFY